MAINEAAWEITEHHTDFARTFRMENSLCEVNMQLGALWVG